MNICGFHITEFFNEKHPMLDTPDDFIGDGNEGMFGFQKDKNKKTSIIHQFKYKVKKSINRRGGK